MGNYVSCALTNISSSPSAKVILPDGEVRNIHTPTKAAELMMDMPHHFLVDAKSLKIRQKFIPLAADDELDVKGRGIYVAFPMKRVASAADASDMARIFLAASKKRAKNVDNRRVSPEEEDSVKLMSRRTKLKLEDIQELYVEELMHRISVSRSKKPKLETIVEEHS